MKKLLLSLSCLSALVLSLQANAQAQREAVRRGSQVIRGGETATGAARSAVNAANRGTQVQSAANAAKASGATASSVDSLFGSNSQAIAGATCNVENFGGVNVLNASRSGVMGATACSTDLSETAKSMAGQMLLKAESQRQAFGVDLSQANTNQLGQMVSAAAKEMTANLGISFSEAIDRIKQICGKCGIFGTRLCQENVLQAASR